MSHSSTLIHIQADPGDRQSQPANESDQRLRLARHLGLTHDLAAGVQHAQAAQLQRHVDPNMMIPWPSLPMAGPRTIRVRASRHHLGSDPTRKAAPVQAHYGIHRTPELATFQPMR